MWSRSSAELITAWTRSRFPLSRYGPLAGLLTAAALTGGGAEGLAGVLERMVLALLLLFQFRLWDDLADRSRDRPAHPERVIAQASSVRALQGLLAAVTLASVSIVAVRPSVFGTLWPSLVLLAGGALYYRIVRPRLSAIAAAALLLAKYPGFVWILRPPPAARSPVLLAAALVYATFVLFDLTEDDRLARAAGARSVRLFAAGLFAAAAILASVSRPWPGTFVAIASAILMLALFAGHVPIDAGAHRHRAYAGFFVCGLVVAAFYLGDPP